MDKMVLTAALGLASWISQAQIDYVPGDRPSGVEVEIGPGAGILSCESEASLSVVSAGDHQTRISINFFDLRTNLRGADRIACVLRLKQTIPAGKTFVIRNVSIEGDAQRSSYEGNANIAVRPSSLGQPISSASMSINSSGNFYEDVHFMDGTPCSNQSRSGLLGLNIGATSTNMALDLYSLSLDVGLEDCH